MNHPIQQMQAALQFGVVPIELRKTKRGWRAFMPASKTPQGGVDKKSNVEITPGHPMTKAALKMALASRYCADVFPNSDGVFITPRYALKCPRWTGVYGGLPELAACMKRAGLI